MKQSLRRLALAVMLAAVLSCCVFAAEADPATETPAQFYNAMQAHLDQREESFSIVYTGDMSDDIATSVDFSGKNLVCSFVR